MIEFQHRAGEPLLEDRRQMHAGQEEFLEVVVERPGQIGRRLVERQAGDMHRRFRRLHVEKGGIDAAELLHAFPPGQVLVKNRPAARPLFRDHLPDRRQRQGDARYGGKSPTPPAQ